MIRNRRFKGGEIPTGSMADIAFLLLVFFLVTTTIDTDKGLGIVLPPAGDVEIEIQKKNILNCLTWCEENKVNYGILTGFSPENTIRTRATNALWNYYISSQDYGVVECVHQIFLHGVV